jgi:hypothetical protein
MTTLFNTDGIPAPAEDQPKDTDNPLEALVGEGKPFDSTEALAKAKLESDRFIKQLEQENAGMREEINKRATIEDFMEKINKREEPKPSTPVTTPAEPAQQVTEAPDVKGMSEEEVRAFVENQIKQREEQTQAERNIQHVQEELRKAWGDQYPHVLRDKAKELGVEESYLEGLAAEHPTVFLRTVEAHKQVSPVGNVAPPRGQLTSLNDTGTQKKNFKHFENLRKTNPREYWKPQVQNEMHRLAGELGSSFYE